jgi:hypothetical protein
MSYLVCDKCGGYYELQPGESPDDFTDKCECSGHLRYVQDLNDDENLQKVCPKCGSLIEDNDELCPNCGFELKESFLSEMQIIFRSVWILFNISLLTIMAIYFGLVLGMAIVPSIFKSMPGVSIYSEIALIFFFSILTIAPVLAVIVLISRLKNKYLSRYNKKNLNRVAISVAFIITMIISIFGRGFVPNVGLVGALIGGFIAGCIVGKSYNDGFVNGGLSAGIAGFIVAISLILLFQGNITTGKSSDVIVELLVCIVLFIFFSVMGSIGGILGAGIRKRISS